MDLTRFANKLFIFKLPDVTQYETGLLLELPTAADRRQLNSIQLGRDCRSVKSQSGTAAESCNSETASDDHAA